MIITCVLQNDLRLQLSPQLSSRLWQVMHNRDPHCTSDTKEEREERQVHLFRAVEQAPPDSGGDLVDPLRVEESDTDSKTDANGSNGRDEGPWS